MAPRFQISVPLSGLRSLPISLIALCLVSTAAQAQEERPKPVGIKLGLTTITDKQTKSDVGSNVISIGLFYDFIRPEVKSPVVFQVYLDANIPPSPKTSVDTVNSFRFNSEISYNSVGIGAAGKLVLGSNASPVQPYLGAGGGIYGISSQLKITATNPFLDTLTERHSKTALGFGGKVFAGVQTMSGLFIDAEYSYLPSGRVTIDFNGVPVEFDPKLGGFSAHIGYRF